MPLIKCPDCNTEVSDRAATCIKCGAPLKVEAAVKPQAIPEPVNNTPPLSPQAAKPAREAPAVKRAVKPLNKKIIIAAAIGVVCVGAVVAFLARPNPERLYKTATMYLDEKNYDAAIDYFYKAQRALRPNPRSRAVESAILRGKAETYSLKGFYSEAIVCYSMAIIADSVVPDYWLGRGVAYDNIGYSDSAIADFSAAIRLDSTNALYWSMRGVTHSNKGNFTYAVDDLTEALRLDPDNSDYKRFLDSITTAQNSTRGGVIGIVPGVTIKGRMGRGVSSADIFGKGGFVSDIDAILSGTTQTQRSTTVR